MVEARVGCRTPSPGRDGVTRIPAWKFDLLRRAILDVLDEGACALADLNDRVRLRLNAEDLGEIGSLVWHVTTVKLELEVRGEIARVPGATPQRVTRERPV